MRRSSASSNRAAQSFVAAQEQLTQRRPLHVLQAMASDSSEFGVGLRLLLNSRWFVLLAIIWIFARQKIAGARVLCQKRERVAQNPPLKLAHVGATHAVAYLKSFRIESARRAHLR